ncbi:uncharacterized protein B0H18DRAFT_1096662 [Fomitopsis serialis]|uniref:uncharacterized protein n=1 Tax=Fomitopsis serialis TaxID=139415 RepID=UPI0020083F5E|nr:uncharacterized protein B0H18DRAFT_1096662 [Neoantrodia serialis]KAH9916789.1 hypothetical protein B0H18DRAFT_1096662 [Neoantrodia serialis]
MANLIRSPKSGSDWTGNDLVAYNIKIRLEPAATFFGDDAMPPPTVDQEILTTQDAQDMSSDSNAELINLLDLAMICQPRTPPVARTRKEIPFYICGQWKHATTDVCLVDRLQNDILLLVQEDERSQPDHPRDPGPQLVMVGIALFGTTPTFYKIPVTAGLVCDVHYGAYPSKPTIVSVHVPELPSPAGRYNEGMKPLDNRQAVLRCYEAFRGIVGI